MTTTDVQTQVEEIARILVMLDADNVSGLIDVGSRLQGLAQDFRDDGCDVAAKAATSAAEIAGSCNDKLTISAGVLESLSVAVKALQDIANDPPGDEAPAVEAKPRIEFSLSPLVDEDIVSEFLGRQTDALGDVEKLVLGFEEGAGEEEMEELKRWFHTLKGEAGLLGLAELADLCHVTEDMIQAEPPKMCVDRLLAVLDWIQTAFDFLAERGPAPVVLDDLNAQLKNPVSVTEEVEGLDEPDDEPTEEADALEETRNEVETVDVVPEVVAESAAEPEPTPSIVLPTVELPDYTSMNVLEGDVGLLQDFIAESNEHLDAAEAHLLTIEVDPKATEALNAVFRGFHTIKGLAGFAELDHIQLLAHKAENLLDMGRKGELELRGTAMDLVFESVDMMKRLVAGVVQALATTGHPAEVADLADLVARLIVVTSSESFAAPVAEASAPEPEPAPEPENVAPAGKSGFVPLANMKKKIPAPAAKAPAGKSGFVPLANMKKALKPAPSTSPELVVKPAPKTEAKQPTRNAVGAVKVKEAVRVDAERLDRLIETIGEMVIAESMVSQSDELRKKMSVKLGKDLDHLDKISRELQEIGMSLRMVPVRPVFQKMARLVRDLAKKTGRHVEFAMSGEDTELDKNVVDKIGDPLVHMVRNAVDHGLEPSDEAREAAGKSAIGRVELRAFHKGGNICIEIEDDGRGLPREAILQKAIERGLVREGDILSEREINNLIFEPGFSTAKQVTDISGRGVGMDVVRRNIEELRGTCDISSTPGEGSTFSIKLPLTLAIIEGMVISCGSENYIVPTLSVVRLVRPRPGDISMVFDRGEMMVFEDEHLPLFRLGNLFDVEAGKTDPEDAVVVVVEEDGRKIGLLADDLLGQQSIVIKSLGESMQNADGIAGGAIMSNGNVALILDVAGLIRVAHEINAALPVEVEGLPEPEPVR